MRKMICFLFTILKCFEVFCFNVDILDELITFLERPLPIEADLTDMRIFSIEDKIWLEERVFSLTFLDDSLDSEIEVFQILIINEFGIVKMVCLEYISNNETNLKILENYILQLLNALGDIDFIDSYIKIWKIENYYLSIQFLNQREDSLFHLSVGVTIE